MSADFTCADGTCADGTCADATCADATCSDATCSDATCADATCADATCADATCPDDMATWVPSDPDHPCYVCDEPEGCLRDECSERIACAHIDNDQGRLLQKDGKNFWVYQMARFRWFPHPNDAVRLFQRYFLNRTDKFCIIAPWGSPCPAEPLGNLVPALRAHVAVVLRTAPTIEWVSTGKHTRKPCSGYFRIGTYTPNAEGMTKWVCLDFDGGSDHANALANPTAVALSVLSHAGRLGIPAYLERSGGGKGWHVWIFFSQPVSAVHARTLGIALAPTDAPLANGTLADPAAAKGIEVFPKSNRIKSGGLGNQVWLPWHHEAKPGGNEFYRDDAGGPEPYIPRDFDTLDEASLERVLEAVAPPGLFGAGLAVATSTAATDSDTTSQAVPLAEVVIPERGVASEWDAGVTGVSASTPGESTPGESTPGEAMPNEPRSGESTPPTLGITGTSASSLITCPAADVAVELDLSPERSLNGLGSDIDAATSVGRSGERPKFSETKRNRPCVICNHIGWCSYSECGTWAVCRRVSNHSTYGTGKNCTDKSGGQYWSYQLIESSRTDTAWPEPRHNQREGKGERADPETLNQVYRLILNNLPYTSAHREALTKRGLDDKSWQIRRGYRTLGKGRAKAVQAVIRAGLESKLPGIPGVFVQDKEGSGKRYWTIAGAGGLAIPICDEQGRIVALSVRVDDDAHGGKYRYVSGTKHGGASPGSPVHVPPMAVCDTKTIRVTEGALKADIAQKLTGMRTIGLPGVGSWQRGIEVAKALGAETIRVAFDADARTNRMVAGHLDRLIKGARKAGLAVELETWDAADGKGIDDVLAAGKTPTVRTAEIDITLAVTEIVALAEKADPKPSDGAEADDDPHRLARLFLACFDNRPKPEGKVQRFWRSQFWRWTGTFFRHVPDDEIRAEINVCIKTEFDRLAKEAEDRWRAAGAKDKPPRTMQVKTSLVSNVMQALTGLTLLPNEVESPCWVDDNDKPEQRGYIAMANGLLDMDAVLDGRSDVLHSHSPHWFSSVCLPYGFDPDADCPRWLAFLDKNLEGDAERIDLLQEWFGYCLTHDTSFQKFLALEGEGCNGKSVICGVLTAMLGPKNVAHVPLEKFADRFSLTQTLGKLANIAAEVGELDKAAEGTLKMYTGGDGMMFDRKGIAPVEAMPTARFVMATNNRPRFSDRSGGLWRRMILFPLRVVIAEGDKVLGMDQPAWWEKSGELPGLFNWALVGLQRLRRAKRFTNSTICTDALNQYRTEINPARMFLLESCVAKADAEVITAMLYFQYREYCTRNGRQPLANTEFGKEVRRVFPTVKLGKTSLGEKRVDAYKTLAFNPDATDQVQHLLPLLPDSES